MSTTTDATTATKPLCDTVDLIVEWTRPDGTLQVHEGDLVLHMGRFEQLATVSLTAGGRVKYALDGWTSVAIVAPDSLVAVRRYIEHTED